MIVRELPDGRLARVAEFRQVERRLLAVLDPPSSRLVENLSPVFKTPEEAEAGSPLFLDMLEDAKLLVDRGGFSRGRLDQLDPCPEYLPAATSRP